VTSPFEPLPETTDALERLSRFGAPDVGHELFALAQRIRSIVPECVGVSLGLIEDGITLTVVATDDVLAGLDAVQYLDGGPCIAAEHRTEPLEVSAEDLLDERQWRMYAQASAAVGVASSLSMPIMDGDRVLGGVNMYASSPAAFEGRHEELARAVGASAEHAVANADLSFSTRLRATEAPQTLQDAEDVNVALGIIAEAQGVDIGTAQERLRQAAARAGISEAEVARAVRHIRTT
jgi:GAF domain-containing protein